MSRLSPDSLFHFTSCLENLVGILDNTFYPRYCWEPFQLIDNHVQPSTSTRDAFPMVCFCDITLSQLMKHIGTYGKYGLGMKKEWGIRKVLNPVIYFSKNSSMANRLSVVINGLVPDTDPTAKAFGEIMLYIKPYEGILPARDWAEIDEDARYLIEPINVRFYDEHEWRYVPDRDVMRRNKIKWSIPQDMYLTRPALADANKKLETDQTRLSFAADDIKYIIIEEERQINEMIRILRSIKNTRYDTDTVDRLASRIITVEQIESDF